MHLTLEQEKQALLMALMSVEDVIIRTKSMHQKDWQFCKKALRLMIQERRQRLEDSNPSNSFDRFL